MKQIKITLTDEMYKAVADLAETKWITPSVLAREIVAERINGISGSQVKPDQSVKETGHGEVNKEPRQRNVPSKPTKKAPISEEDIDAAHEALQEELDKYDGNMDAIPNDVFEYYSERCGVPVDALKTWLKSSIVADSETRKQIDKEREEFDRNWDNWEKKNKVEDDQ